MVPGIGDISGGAGGINPSSSASSAGRVTSGGVQLGNGFFDASPATAAVMIAGGVIAGAAIFLVLKR